MKTNPLLDDLLTLGGSLFGNLVEARHELKAQAKGQVETIARRLDLVTRDEFDAAFAMLAKARAMQEDLQERLERIESHLRLTTPAKKKNTTKARLPSVKKNKRHAKQK